MSRAAAVLLLASLSRHLPVAATQTSPETREAARRIVATAHLAAQEYALAWQGGAITRREEADEARLFIGEARRSVAALPAGPARDAALELGAIARLLDAGAPADSVAAHASALERRLAGVGG